MIALLFEHYVDDRRHELISAENNKVGLKSTERYWNFLGLVDVKNPYLAETLDRADSMLEISEEMFEIDPGINKVLDDVKEIIK